MVQVAVASCAAGQSLEQVADHLTQQQALEQVAGDAFDSAGAAEVADKAQVWTDVEARFADQRHLALALQPGVAGTLPDSWPQQQQEGGLPLQLHSVHARLRPCRWSEQQLKLEKNADCNATTTAAYHPES